MAEMGQFTSAGGSSDFVASKDADAYNEEWQVDDASIYIGNPKGTGGGQINRASQGNGGSQAPMTSMSRGNGQATVRNNKAMDYNTSIPFNGSLSGTIAIGSTISGRDSNNNGIPDLLEKCIKNGACHWR